MDIKTLFEKFEERRIIIDNHPGRWVLWSDVEKIFDELKAEIVRIPQNIADFIETKKSNGIRLFDVIKRSDESVVFNAWLQTDDNMTIFIRAWIEGYEVEKEKRYLVKIKVTNDYLHVDNFSRPSFSSQFKTEVTKTMLDNLGLSEVFSNPLFEVEEVK
mgnify:CR=1 FL=1